MATSLIDRVTDAQLQSERSALLLWVGMSEDELLARGDAWTLTTEDQWRAHSRIEDIRFLLELDD